MLEDWRGGRTSWEHWGDATERARDLFARLVGVPPERVAAGANTSAFVGLAAAALPDGARVVSAEPEFTSLLWPFLVQGRDIEVTAAGWYAGEDPHASYYGAPPRLARGARRFDVSPAWFPWIGTAPTLRLLLDIGVEAVHEHDLRLANSFREGLGLAAGDPAIVSVELPEAEECLRGPRVMAAARAGLLRTSWRVHNTDDDVRELLELLGR